MTDPGFPRHTQITLVSVPDDDVAGIVMEICNEKRRHTSIVSFEELLHAYLTFQLARPNRIREQVLYRQYTRPCESIYLLASPIRSRHHYLSPQPQWRGREVH